MKIGILGAGHGGLAMSADLKLMGHKVLLSAVEEHSLNLKLLKAMGSITIDGVSCLGTGSITTTADFVCDDIKETIEFGEIIFINVPAFAQEDYNECICKYGKNGQIIVYPCGGFSALNFYNQLKRYNREKDFIVGETSSFIYTTKIIAPAKVLIKSIKDKVLFSSIKKEDTIRALSVLNKIYPQFKPAQNIWQTSFNNPSSVLHTITTLLNMSRIEQFGSYKNSNFDITPSVARVMEKVDKERVEVAKHFYNKPMSVTEIMNSLYSLNHDNIYDVIMGIKAYKIQHSPANMQHRYISEDIPYSLVPIATLAKKLDLKTPNMDSIINLACMCNDKDYWQEGRNADKIGFSKDMIEEREKVLI